MEHKVKLQPMIIPDYVLTEPKVGTRQEGMIGTPKFHLSELSEETLIELCDDFKQRVLEKAKQDTGQ